MTTTTTFQAPTTPAVRRKWENGPPMIVPAGESEAVEYDRPSSIDVFSDTAWLTKWSARTVIDGIVADPAIVDEWKAARASLAKVAVMNGLTDRAKRAGGGMVKAELGTEFHDHAAKHLEDRTYQPPVEFVLAIAALVTELDLAGLTVVATEKFIVNDRYRMAGTFDMIVCDRFGRHYVLDIKTGSLHPVALAMQLYVYADAPYYFEQGAALDGSQDLRTPKPQCEITHGYVAEINIDKGTCKIRPVDLTEAPALLALRAEVLAVRELKTIGDPLTSPAEILAAVDAMFPGTVEVSVVDDEWREWITDRIAKIIVNSGELTLVGQWPAGVPTLRSGDEITLAHAEKIERAVAFVEADLGLDFAPFKPGTEPAPAPRPAAITRRPAPDEGADVTFEDVKAIDERASALDPEAREWVGAIVKAATKAKRNIRMSGPGGRRSERRLAIASALVAIASHTDDDLARALLTLAMGEEVQPGHDLGDAFGSLTIAEANRLCKLAQAIDDLTLTALWSGEGVEIAGDITAALAA